MTDSKIWEKYYKTKSWYKKEQLIKTMFSTTEFESFDKICEEFLNSKSTRFRNAAINIIEILAVKFGQLEPNKIPNYLKLLERYKIKNVLNFWYKDFKTTSLDKLFEVVDLQIEKKAKEIATKGYDLHYKFPINDHLEGYLSIKTWNNDGKHDTHLDFGFITELRDYHLDMINNSPSDNVHQQQRSGQIGELFGNYFKIKEATKVKVIDYFTFVNSHYSNLIKIQPENYEESEYLKLAKNKFNHGNDLWSLLSLININLQERKLDNVLKFKEIGLQKITPKMAGSAWRVCFQ
jgi:hypothetical protein